MRSLEIETEAVAFEIDDITTSLVMSSFSLICVMFIASATDPRSTVNV